MLTSRNFFGQKSLAPQADEAVIKVCHLAMADLAAGAETQLATLLARLAKMSDLQVSAVLFNEGYLASELRRLGIHIEVIPESQHNSLSLFLRLVEYFGRHNIDIVHTHKYKDNILGNLASLFRGVRARIRTVHGFLEPFDGFEATKMMLYDSVDNFVNRCLVDQLLAVSLDLRKELIKHFGAEKVIQVHNAIELDTIQVTPRTTELRKELAIGEKDFLIGSMGRLVPVKGLESFLLAARIIRHHNPTCKFIIAGDGPLKDDLREMAREYGIEESVRFLGHRGDSYDVLHALDIFVLSSLSEGIPMVLLEALALSRPVVATRVGGVPEVIEHGLSGLLVAPGNHEALAQACISLMDDYRIAEALGAAGHKRVEEAFSAKSMADQVADMYRELVARRRGA